MSIVRVEYFIILSSWLSHCFPGNVSSRNYSGWLNLTHRCDHRISSDLSVISSLRQDYISLDSHKILRECTLLLCPSISRYSAHSVRIRLIKEVGFLALGRTYFALQLHFVADGLFWRKVLNFFQTLARMRLGIQELSAPFYKWRITFNDTSLTRKYLVGSLLSMTPIPRACVLDIKHR